MALTAMIGLDGLAMGIAAIACVGGSFTNGIVFHRLRLGDKSNVIAVTMEPLTQAPIITANSDSDLRFQLFRRRTGRSVGGGIPHHQ